MYDRFTSYFAHNKYRLMILLLLAGASVFSVAIWRIRADYSHTDHYNFLVWNLFLAWIPFMISYFTYIARLSRKQIYFVIPTAALLWLIFFPNAPYILTDFQHLSKIQWRDLPVWYDVMMLIWFAFTGLLLGMVSLFLMHEIMGREFGRWVGWGFVAIVAGLTGAGVYAGRFLRFNSWDIFRHPRHLALYTLQSAQDSGLRSIGFVTLFTAFFLFLYITLYTFAHLFAELQRNDQHRDDPSTF